ncbi:hypothetical protein O76HUS_15070 [Escherichia coli]|nr:hypothetical protein O76HUS_15070 [Escherichia coli]
MIPVWSTACPDWAERLKKGLSIIPAPIYPDQAAHALAIFKQLRIVDAPGSPTFGSPVHRGCLTWWRLCLAPTMRRPVSAISRKCSF